MLLNDFILVLTITLSSCSLTATTDDLAWSHPVFLPPATADNQTLQLSLYNDKLRPASAEVDDGNGRQVSLVVGPRSAVSLAVPRPTLDRTPLTIRSLLIRANQFLHVSTVHLGSCSSSYSLPASDCGTEYEVITWPPSESDGGTTTFSVSTLSPNASAVINIRFSQPTGNSTPCYVLFGSVRLPCGQNFRLLLRYLETATFTSSTLDLSGTVLESSVPVAVHAGNSHVRIGPGNATDTTIEQLFPVRSWGTHFVVSPIPENDHSGYSIRLTSGGSDTASVVVDGAGYRLERHRALTVDFVDNRPVYVVASQPVQLIQFVRGATVDSDSGAPAALVVPAVELFNSSYSFQTPSSSGNSVDYLTLVVPRSAVDGLRLNESPIAVDAWNDVGGGSWMRTAAVPVTANTHVTVRHVTGRTFGAYLYGFDKGSCALAYPAGVVSPLQPAVSPTSIRPTEPTSVGCVTTNTGTSFVLAFPDSSNVDDDAYQLDIYPTSLGPRSSVDVVAYGNLPTGDRWNSSVDYVPGESLVVDVPPSVQMKGVELAARAVYVQTTEPVAVFAASWNRSRASCDGFLVFPVDALGTDYFTVNFFPPSDQSELTVVAVEDGTTVEITISNYTRPFLVVVWHGANYSQGSVIRVAMNRNEVMQIRNGRDLSGTRITSDKPVAVFSGNTEKNGTDGEHVVEQMPPIDGWGSTFYLVTLPGFAGTYNFKYVSATPNNTVTVTKPTGPMSFSPQTLDEGAFYPRGSQSYLTATTLVRIRASGKLLVAQFAGNSRSVDIRQHAMMIVPPVELFRPSYSFSTGPNPAVANFTHYLIVVVNGSAVGGLLLDGLPVDSTGWEPFDVTGEDAMVGRTIVVDPGIHLIAHVDGVPFGAYVYGHAEGVCSYAYAAGSCLGRPDNLTTYPPFTTAAPSATTTPLTDTTAGTAVTLSHSPSTTAPASQTNGWQITDCTCLNLTSNLQPTYNGVYYRYSSSTDQTYYKRPPRAAGSNLSNATAGCDFFIYLLTGEVSTWAVGPVVGGRHAAIVADGALTPPYNVTRWKSFSGESARFVDDHVTMTCTCSAVTSWRTVEFLDRQSGESRFDGPFQLINSTYNGRPVFVYSSRRASLYFRYSDCDGGTWSVGSLVGGHSVVMYLNSTAVDPSLIRQGQGQRDDTWVAYNVTSRSFEVDSRVIMTGYV